MKNTLQIEIPKGFEVESFDMKKGVVKFKETPKDVREKLKNFKDILKYHGLSKKEFESNNQGLSPDEIGYRKEKLIVAAYNKGKLPNWTDRTPKYYPLFKMGPSGLRYHGYDVWGTRSLVGSRLCFCGPNAKDNMLDAVKKFLPAYEESRTL